MNLFLYRLGAWKRHRMSWRELTALTLAAFMLMSCTTKTSRIQADIDFFRKECAETNDNVACMHYQESLAKMTMHRQRQAMMMGAVIGKQQERSMFSPVGSGSVIHY